MATVSGPGTLFCSECGRPTAPDELARFGDRLVCPICKESYAQKLREGVPAAAAIPYAGFWIRFVAWIIDAVVLMVIDGIVQFAVLGSSVATIPRFDPNTNPMEVLGPLMAKLGVVYLIGIIVGCSYEAGFVGSSLSATPGKLALGLRVLRPNGARVGFGRAAGRHFAKILSLMILLIGFIIAGFDAQKRALHDMICDTRVIKI
jgi:uncharacterized RDD family membrane protein YckC